MGLLDEIVDGAVSDVVSTSSLLRKVQVVTTRLGATELIAWVKDELNGYPTLERLPTYRSDIKVNVMGEWSGYIGRQMSAVVDQGRIPDEAASLFAVSLTQSVSELEQLAALDNDPSVPWEPTHVAIYGTWLHEGLAAHIAGYNLVSARKIVTIGTIRGVLNAVRNHALELALELQLASPDAGSSGGPTVALAPIAESVVSITNHIYGDGAQVASGHQVHQETHMTVMSGDLEGLLRCARELGLDEEGKMELATAVLADEHERPGRIQRFMAKIGEGTFIIGAGTAVDVIGAQISRLIGMYLGGN